MKTDKRFDKDKAKPLGEKQVSPIMNIAIIEPR